MMTKIGTEVAPVTRESDTIFKVKRAMVKVTRPLQRPQKGGEGQGHIVAAAAYSLLITTPLHRYYIMRCLRVQCVHYGP